MGKPFYTYILECCDGSYYVGHADDLEKRIFEHSIGAGCRYTSARLPVKLLWSCESFTRYDAKAIESKIKKWDRAKKEALMKGDFDLLSKLASRSAEDRALRDDLLRKSPQGRGSPTPASLRRLPKGNRLEGCGRVEEEKDET